MPLLSDPRCHLGASVHLHKPGNTRGLKKKKRCQGPSSAGDVFLRSSCDQVHHPITCRNRAGVNSNTTSPRADVLCHGPPPIKPRQGPKRDKREPEVVPFPAICFCILLNQIKDGSMRYLFHRPTCSRQEENSAQGRTLHIYY